MTGNEFKTARKTRLGYTQSELGTAMGLGKRMIQEIEAHGDTEIRDVYARFIELLIWKDQIVMQAVIEKVDRDIARQYPAGIPAAPEKDQ